MRVIGVLAAILLLLVGLRMCVGTSSFGFPAGEFRDYAYERWRPLRSSAVIGVALAVSGVCLQSLLRNQLAEPAIIGLASGAGVGVVAYLTLLQFGVMVLPQYIWATIGAAVTMVIVFLASRRRGTLDPLGLLLTGVVLSTVNGAVIMLMRSIMGQRGFTDELSRWSMGHLDQAVDWRHVTVIAILTLVGTAVAVWQGRAMDVAAFSDAEAESLGVNLRSLRTLMFVIPAALTAGSVVLAGPIAFVGLICPHLARFLLGAEHRPVIVASALMGAILIIAADTASAMLDMWFNIGLVPIGVFTALIGGPAFLWMLRPQLGRGME